MTRNNQASTNFFAPMLKPWVICFTGMLFYCFNYFLRSSPSVMQHDLIQSLNLTATQFGTLISFYYFAYTPMQIPAGMIYDKFGVRFVLFFACLTTVFGLSVFVSANGFGQACAGRFLIGLGTAFAYIGVLKLASIWLPPSRFAAAAGLTTAIGMSSAALSQKYLANVVETFGYKPILQTAVLIGIALSFVILYALRHRPKHDNSIIHTKHTPMTTKQLFSSLRMIFANPQMWIIGIIGCVLYLPSVVFLDVYGISYFKIAHHLTSQQAANVSALTFLGWIIGGPIIGIISDKIKRRCLPLMITSAITAILLYIIFYYPGLTLGQLSAIAFIAGLCCGAHPLCFALGKENNPPHLAGTAVAVTNMFIMLGGMIFPPIIGRLLDLQHPQNLLNAVSTYTASDYTLALNIVPLGIVVGTVLTMFLKETHCGSRAAAEEPVFSSTDLDLDMQATNS
ncbi:MAG: MFS transporter [Gammaproteobacteria bacterium]|nr:MFS transporter [Gammaproteobacteria bacterium]